jgi:hypothetical protein
VNLHLTLYHTRPLFTLRFVKEQSCKKKLQRKYKRTFSYTDVRTRDIWPWNCSRQLDAGLSRLRPEHVMVTMALGKVLSGNLGFPQSVSLHQCSILHSAIINVIKSLQLTLSLNNPIRLEVSTLEMLYTVGLDCD